MQRKEAVKGCTTKQALTKPQNEVGVPQKKGRTKEGKGGEPAAPGRRTCGSGPAPPDQRKVGIARSIWFQTRPFHVSRSKGGYGLTNCPKQLLPGRSGLDTPGRVSRRALGPFKSRGILARQGF
jgi:hypothetical protein